MFPLRIWKCDYELHRLNLLHTTLNFFWIIEMQFKFAHAAMNFALTKLQNKHYNNCSIHKFHSHHNHL